MRISAKADYAMRAALELAAAESPPLKRDQIASAQGILVKFLETILGELKHAGIIASQRGADGGYSLARPPEEVTLADVLRVMEGPLASVRDQRPESVSYAGQRSRSKRSGWPCEAACGRCWSASRWPTSSSTSCPPRSRRWPPTPRPGAHTQGPNGSPD
jgi:Rrf2 family protein